MAKFDEQLNRMEYLMGYRQSVNENKKSNCIEYSTVGADGNVYGILKEGAHYYIKVAKHGGENLSESYEYINGFNRKKENEYSSYNEATKQLELKLMSLNEAYGKSNDVSVVDFDRSRKMLSTLTESARKELDRVRQIMENSVNIGIEKNIGDHGNPEGKGTSTGADTVKNNKPFDEKATATLDKDNIKTNSDPKNTDKNYTDADKKAEKNLTSDTAPKDSTNSDNDYKDTHDDLDGEGVADKKPKGGKAVMVNENAQLDDLLYGDDEDETNMDDLNTDNFDDVTDSDTFIGDDYTNPVGSPEAAVGDDIVGSDEDDLDSLMEEFDAVINGDRKELTGDNGSLPVQTCDNNGEGKNAPSKPKEGEEALKGKKGNLSVQTWDKLNESQKAKVNKLVESICGKLIKKEKNKKKETLQEKLTKKIDKIVREEVTKLNVWGQHPKYGKEPMTTPPNTETEKDSAARDWNDDSVKGNERYGKKIGNGAPFDQVVNMLTDSVMKMIKENLALKKK